MDRYVVEAFESDRVREEALSEWGMSRGREGRSFSSRGLTGTVLESAGRDRTRRVVDGVPSKGARTVFEELAVTGGVWKPSTEAAAGD